MTTTEPTAFIQPGATLGMLGGGQLGRMFVIAARTMGYGVIVLDPDPHSPAGALATEHVCAAYDDPVALNRLAETCAAVTTEFENVPADTLATLASACPVRPGASAVAPVQDRIREKSLLDRHAIPTAPWCAVEQRADLQQAVADVATPAILKRARGGYDGKGQAQVDDAAGIEDAFAALGEAPAILEQRIALACEVSVIVCRAVDGAVASYPPAENVHHDGILFTSTVPARIDDDLAERARATAIEVANALDYVGVVGVEMFVTGDNTILVNEIAPRPHNSGHFTLDACATSQFEQQVRLLCGGPPASTRLLTPVAMVNLLGDLWRDDDPDWSDVLGEERAYLHLYGKREPRPGRKMGHINVLADDPSAALARAAALHAALARQ